MKSTCNILKYYRIARTSYTLYTSNVYWNITAPSIKWFGKFFSIYNFHVEIIIPFWAQREISFRIDVKLNVYKYAWCRMTNSALDGSSLLKLSSRELYLRYMFKTYPSIYYLHLITLQDISSTYLIVNTWRKWC